MTDFSKYLFHPSSAGKLMTSSRTKDPIGETTKAHLLECWIGQVYGRKKNITNQYMEKGTLCEEDSLSLYSRVKHKPFFKNKETLSNAFLVGTPDIIGTFEIIDIKTSWDIHTFFSVLHKPINPDYFWQMQCYMALTGKAIAKLVYCLVDTPLHMIEDAKWKLARQMGVIDPAANELYQNACEALEKEMVFGDIALDERYIEFEIVRDEEKIAELYHKILICREFLNAMASTSNQIPV